jgi:hypothetical protein
MPSLDFRTDVPWTNFHLTRGTLSPGADRPQMIVRQVATLVTHDLDAVSGLDRFVASGALLFAYLRRLEAAGGHHAAGMVGTGWSFSALVGTPEWQLDTAGHSGVTGIVPDERHDAAPVPGDHIALVLGGTSMATLLATAEAQGLSLFSSGSFLKPTIAGGFGTASHGSRLGYGGIQNMVLGMHLIVGSGDHVWIEPESAPVLSDAALARLAIDGVPVRLVRDDDRFEDALIHLGGMGIVNGVAIELADNQRFAELERLMPLTPALLDAIGDAQFDRVAAALGCPVAPAFYELTIDPHALFTGDAAHNMYIPTARTAPSARPLKNLARPADAIVGIGNRMHKAARDGLGGGSMKTWKGAATESAVPPWVLAAVLEGSASAFAYYVVEKGFETGLEPFDPDDPARAPRQWSELHQGSITGQRPGALYNASFAIPIERVAIAVPAICAAVADLAASFVFTLRFVARPAGTLAFTRFDHNAVIEIDGLSPLVCQGAMLQADPQMPNADVFLAALAELEQTVPRGAAAVRRALEAEGVPYSMHWAKLGGLDRAKVHADFGHPLDADSLIRRWRDTRDFLLSPFGKSIFWNEALVNYGLLDPV